MKEFQYVLKGKLGMHAKPAGTFVELVKSMGYAVTVSKEDHVVSADRLLALVSLDAKAGDTITVTLEEDATEEEQLRLQTFMEKNM